MTITMSRKRWGEKMIVVTGSVTAREETFNGVRQLSLQHVHRSRNEPGCISHAVHVDCEDPMRLVFIEQWADRAALLAHFAVPASRDFVRALPAAAGSGRHNHSALRRHQTGKSLNQECMAGLPYDFHIAMQHIAP
jgi:quinol monooxygenase YgiN